MDSVWIILVFHYKFYAFKIFLSYIAYFYFFYRKMNKPNIHNNIDTSSFQNGLNNLFSSTGVYLKSKVRECIHKGKNMFLDFWALQAFAWHASDSLCPCYHPWKPRKKRLVRSMKSLPLFKAAWDELISLAQNSQ